MNVGELIEELKKLPPEMTVLLREDYPTITTEALWVHAVKQQKLISMVGKIDGDGVIKSVMDNFAIICSCDEGNISEYKKIASVFCKEQCVQ